MNSLIFVLVSFVLVIAIKSEGDTLNKGLEKYFHKKMCYCIKTEHGLCTRLKCCDVFRYVPYRTIINMCKYGACKFEGGLISPSIPIEKDDNGEGKTNGLEEERNGVEEEAESETEEESKDEEEESQEVEESGKKDSDEVVNEGGKPSIPKPGSSQGSTNEEEEEEEEGEELNEDTTREIRVVYKSE